MSWHSSRDWCMLDGGDLASIRNEEERLFIYNTSRSSIFHGPVWIGLNALQDEEMWRWTDGANFTYSNWHEDEPSKVNRLCAYQFHRDLNSCFNDSGQVDYIRDLISEPNEADGKDTFNFGNDYTGDCIACLEKCRNSANCTHYTKFGTNAWYPWNYMCMGRTNKTWAAHSDTAVDCSGSRRTCDLDGDWYNENCGATKGFVCKKQKGGDVPVTAPPTEVVPGYCPLGFIEYGNKCYFISDLNNEEDELSWENAKRKCQGQPGINPDLASFHSEEEMAVVTMHMYGRRVGFWIGIHQNAENGPWIWSDNSRTNYMNWKHPPDGTGQLCGEVWTVPGPTGTWNALDCNERRDFICQILKDPSSTIPTPYPTTPSVKCPSGYRSYWTSCYRLGEPGSWQESNTACEDGQGGQLTSIMDGAENAAVFTIFSSTQDEPLWIGLNRADKMSEWLWVDNWPVAYTNWDSGQPENIDNSFCAAFRPNGRWESNLCTQQYQPLCKINTLEPPTQPPVVEGSCPDEMWKHFGGHCYWFGNYMSAEWDSAEADCIQRGGTEFESHLVSIHSYAENKFILDSYRDAGNGWDAWIGKRTSNKNDPFTWSDGSPDQFEYMLPGEPKDPDKYQCMVMITDTGYSQPYWATSECSNYKRYACKADKIPDPTPPPPANGTCPDEYWTEYGPYCFKAFGMNFDGAKKWDKAGDTCKTFSDGFLTSVRDELETNLLMEIVRNATSDVGDQVHVGLQLVENDPMKFEWIDGTDFTYTNWADEEPNGGGGFDGCVWMDSRNEGKWELIDCRNARGYICRTYKQDVEGISTTVTTSEKTTLSATTTASPTLTPTEQDTTDGYTRAPGLSGGAVTGIVIGVMACLTLLGAVGLLYVKGRLFQSAYSEPQVDIPDTVRIQNPSQPPYNTLDNMT